MNDTYISQTTVQQVHPSHLSRVDSRTQGQVRKQRPHRSCTQRYVEWIMGKNQKIQRGPGQKIAKVATEISQNSQSAEFRESFEMKVVEHQILCGKLVSQANFKPPSPKLD